MLGSDAADPAVVCDAAGLLGLHSNTVDRIATADGAANFDERLMM